MRPGKLDRLIDIQRKTQTITTSGDVQESWSNIAARKPASMSPVNGDERFATPETVALEQIEFRVRYSDVVAALTPLDRIIHPAMNTGDTDIPARRVHNVLAVHEIGRREGLKIITERRPDVT